MTDISVPVRMKHWSVTIDRDFFIIEEPNVLDVFRDYHGELWTTDDLDRFDKTVGGTHPADHQPSQLAVIQLVGLIRDFNERESNGKDSSPDPER